MRRLLDDVRLFHQVTGSRVAHELDTEPTEEKLRLRVRLISEEYLEAVESVIGYRWYVRLVWWLFQWCIRVSSIRLDLANFSRELVDSIYVIVGTAVSLGIPLDRVWNEVQRANMAKAGGPRRADGKVMKPPGWKPPDIDRALYGGNSNG